MGKGTKPSKPKPVAKEPSSTGSVSSRVVASALIAVVAIVAALALPRARESGGGAKPRANSSGSSRDAFGPCTAAEFIGDAPVPGFHVVCLHASPEGGRNGASSGTFVGANLRVQAGGRVKLALNVETPSLVDCNPGTGTVTTEFDCPANAWFFEGSSNDCFMPYSILMEIALQQ